MYKNIKHIILIVLIYFLTLNANEKNKHDFDDTSLLLYAIDYEINNKFNSSKYIYLLLFESYPIYEYLEKIIILSFKTNDFKTINELTSKYKNIFIQHEERLSGLEIVSLMRQNKYQEAFILCKSILNKFPNSSNYETMGYILFELKKYKQSSFYFQKSYIDTKNPKILLLFTDIQYLHLNQKKESIQNLETYLINNECSYDICNKLYEYYQKDKNIDGMLRLLKKIYYSKKDKPEHKETIEPIVTKIVNLLILKDMKSAIDFLEKNKINDLRLLSLYQETKNYYKTLKLVTILYNKTKNYNFLAQMAILEYEIAKDKSKVLHNVVNNFSLVVENTNNDQYQNYLGYLLIDHDLDIEKGIKLVLQALKKYPDNISYIDSLAWGYYKLKNCKKAQEIFSKIDKKIILNNKELKNHNEGIRECK